MRRGWKIFWIVCACLGLLGVVCCATGLALGATPQMIAQRFPHGFGFSVEESESNELNEPEVSSDEGIANYGDTYENVHSLELDIYEGRVEILRTDADKVSVELVQDESKTKVSSRMDEGELEIQTEKRWYGISGAAEDCVVRVYIPRSLKLNEVSLGLETGSMYVESVEADSLSIDVGAGEATLDDFTAREVDMDCGAGQITAIGEGTTEIDIDCGVGRIVYTAPGNESNYNYKLSCGIGQITCGNNNYSSIGAEQKINNGAAKEMDIDCGIGQVEVNFEN